MLNGFWNAVGDPAAKETAKWYPTFGDLKNYRKIKVQNLNDSRTDYRVVGDNMNAQGSELMLKTRFPYRYTVTSHIYYRHKWHEIARIDTRNFPSGGYGGRKEYVLHLIEVNYGRDFADTTNR